MFAGTSPSHLNHLFSYYSSQVLVTDRSLSNRDLYLPVFKTSLWQRSFQDSRENSKMNFPFLYTIHHQYLVLDTSNVLIVSMSGLHNPPFICLYCRNASIYERVQKFYSTLNIDSTFRVENMSILYFWKADVGLKICIMYAHAHTADILYRYNWYF